MYISRFGLTMTESIFIICLVLLNAYFVMCEIVLVSIRKTRIEENPTHQKHRKQLVIKALQNLSLFISATQIGITVTSILLGRIGTLMLEHTIHRLINQFYPNLSHFSMPVSISLVAFFVIVYLQLVLGELVPKHLALQKPEKFSLYLIPPLYVLTVLMGPAIWVTHATTNMVMKLLGTDGSPEEKPYSEKEIELIIKESTKKGIISRQELWLAQRIFRLKHTQVKKIMIPKDKIVCFNHKKTVGEVFRSVMRSPHRYNRYPIYKDSPDHIIGYIHLRDIIQHGYIKSKNLPLNTLNCIQKLNAVNELDGVDHALAYMKQNNLYAAAVIGERQRTLGMVTFADIVDFILQNFKAL